MVDGGLEQQIANGKQLAANGIKQACSRRQLSIENVPTICNDD